MENDQKNEPAPSQKWRTEWMLVGGYVDSASSLVSLLSCGRGIYRALSEDDYLWKGWYLERWGGCFGEDDDTDYGRQQQQVGGGCWRISYLRRLGLANDVAIATPNPRSPGWIYASLRNVMSYREEVNAGHWRPTINPWLAENCPDWMEQLALSVYFWDVSTTMICSSTRRRKVTFQDCYCGRSVVFDGDDGYDVWHVTSVKGAEQSRDESEGGASSSSNDDGEHYPHSYVLDSGAMELGPRLPRIGCAIYSRKQRDPVVIVIEGYEVNHVQYDMYGSQHEASASVSLSIYPPLSSRVVVNSFKLIGMEQAYAFWEFGDRIKRLMEDLANELGVPDGEDPRIILFLAFQGIIPDFFGSLKHAAQVEY